MSAVPRIVDLCVARVKRLLIRPVEVVT